MGIGFLFLCQIMELLCLLTPILHLLYSVNDLIVKVKNRVEVSDNCEFPLSFPKRVQLQRDMVYTVCVTISGDDIYFGIGGLETVQTVVGLGKRVKVSFLDSLCSETTVQRGQIKGLILC